MKYLRHLAVMAMLFAPATTWATPGCSTAGVDLPLVVTIDGSESAPLTLNGAGARATLFWDVYVGALYLPTPSTSVQTVLSMPGPKRLWLYFVRGVNAARLLRGWRDGLESNNDPVQLAALEARLQRSSRMFRDMKAGESIALDYLPGVGTRLWMEGASGPVIPGADFYQAVLKIWLGRHPAQKTLKECLLGKGEG